MSDRTAAGSGFSPEERAAMKEAAAERRRAARAGSKAEKAAADLQDVLDRIAAMAPDDRGLAEQVHAIVAEAAPGLAPKTWYGMPAWARDGKPVVFFQDAGKFKARYATLGFNDGAALDDGAMWPTAFALVRIGPEERALIAALARRAAGAEPVA